MIQTLLKEMFTYYAGDPARIQHFTKVYAFASYIGKEEGLSDKQQFILEAASIVHDIGIKPAEEKYANCSGRLQEQEGPSVAEKMLVRLSFPEDVIQRVSYLVGHHHTYTDIDGMDYQILVEADFLVNLYEDHMDKAAAAASLKHIFRTGAGTALCQKMFDL